MSILNKEFLLMSLFSITVLEVNWVIHI